MVENFFEIHIDLPRLRTAPALNLCEIQVTQINHDSFYEITKTFSFLRRYCWYSWAYIRKSCEMFFLSTLMCSQKVITLLYIISTPQYIISFKRKLLHSEKLTLCYKGQTSESIICHKKNPVEKNGLTSLIYWARKCFKIRTEILWDAELFY